MVEIEAYRRVADRVLGRTIAKVHAPDAWYLKDGTSPRTIARVLKGKTITGTRRIGKLLLVDTDGPTIGMRFGMTGRLIVDGVEGVAELIYSSKRKDPAWDRFALTFTDGSRLVINDPRRLGGVSLDPHEARMGHDADEVSLKDFTAVLQSDAPLKARLMTQHRLAGIGNLIADETLWRAGLAPDRPARSLAPAEIKALHKHLKATLRVLHKRGGSHTGDLIAHRKPGGRCPKDGAALARATVGGRTTWWCPAHQH
ncbi:MAG TPA: DNA-formamidopyrimidine glycosylase family protein [Acidimicrobiales bacterium]|nr:DNA-formamidopyrimidine glycosylase family protein [Acidimicrobiales bacterium]